ncbi:SURF1 family protein [Rhodoferax sp. BAB1]|uniref:SURF1 family protein n=1 Tax=Rhodoferax sp. BAB1 TaxID=2741720 RepID=UPI0020C5D015|nr:SURF1 family protein [Rhodoferax sp. BAB1]
MSEKGRFWVVTVAALLGVALTLALGRWQLGRADEKQALQARIDARAQLPVLDGRSLAGVLDEELLHRRIEALGQWLPQYTVFLDNRQMNGRPGFYVLTPLRLDGGAVVLVQRGWVPRNFEDRLRVPQIDTPAGLVKVQGRIAPAPSKLYEMGEAGSGAIRQNLDLAQFRVETGLALVEGSIQQTGATRQDDGLLRDWPQINTGVDKHYGYAFQWFGLCALITLLYVWFQIVRRYKQRQA